MSDSLQMMDLVSMSKNLTRLRSTDPEQWATANRLAGAAAAHRLEALHQDVEEAEESDEAKLRDRSARRDGGQGGSEQQADGKGPPPEPVPEQNEGHLLNLKA